MLPDTDLHRVLGADGPVAAAIEGFRPRSAQQAMAQSIADALQAGESLVTEAGTGTGKTFAYLAPVLLAGDQAIVSTGTRTLQDQLYHRDLPQMCKALAVPVAGALLKGRANYLCRYRLARCETGGTFTSRRDAGHLVRIGEWARQTVSGDIGELGAVPERSPVWYQVTSTTDNCLGQECPDYNDCYLVKARRRAQEADLVVVNHHLLCADLALKDQGVGQLLSADAGVVVIDEAHQLPDTASLFFSTTLSGRQLLELASDSRSEALSGAGESHELLQLADQLEKATQELRLAFGQDSRRAAWHTVAQSAHITASVADLQARLATLISALASVAERSKGLENCARRGQELGRQLDFLSATDDSDTVRWFETRSRGFALNATPLDIATPFSEGMAQQGGAWIFTSATLSVSGDFKHFRNRMGLADVAGQCWPSPFAFAEQALLYQPTGLPEPRDSGYTEAVLAAALPVIRASGGRTFFLFTSHRALQLAAGWLQERLEFPLLVQGQAPRGEMLQRFRELGNAVLLGTGSFWEGVDVKGAALSCVIIDKLPFATPDDPVLQARMHACERQGGRPFFELQIPQAVIALKQGAGRLIRDAADTGVLMLCDPRLISKGYGRIFMNSLPSMPRTTRLADVEQFFEHLPVAGEALPS